MATQTNEPGLYGVMVGKPQKPKPIPREERRRAKEQEIEVQYVDGPTLTEDEEWFRHFNWRDKRKRVRQALLDAGSTQNAMNNFDNCGSDCSIEYSESEKRYRVCACYCHSRHCQPCMKAKSALIVRNLRKILTEREKKQYRFVTLTMKHSSKPLREQIKRLYSCYKELRKTPLWKRSQHGGAATLEIKWIAKTRMWHPHLHIISEGNYLSTYHLSDEWKRITGDSHIVDIRIISADKDVAYYVGKYITKGTNDEVWQDAEASAEWVKAVKGVRMCATFGNWRGLKLLAREKEKPGEWKTVASLASMVRRAHAGEEHALRLLIVLTETCQYNPNRQRRPKPK